MPMTRPNRQLAPYRIALTMLGIVGLIARPVGAGPSVPSTLDADSYLYFGTHNASSPELSVGVDLSGIGVYHFNFGVIAFDDLTGIGLHGEKHLRIELENYAYTQIVDGFPVTTLSPFGEATFKLVALDAPYSDYLAETDKPGWYNTHIGGAQAIASVNFSGANEIFFEVTDTVNAWIDYPLANHGFAIVLTAGTPVELGASEGGNGPVLLLTLPGDTDSDGDIDDSDLGTALANYTGPVGVAGAKAATHGDTDGDGDIDDSDLGTAFAGYTGPLGPALVPEPGWAALFGLTSLFMLRRRHSPTI